MDEATSVLKNSLEEAKIGRKEKITALKRLKKFIPD